MSVYSELVLSHANLVAYWKLDEASGTLVDGPGTNDLTAVGATYSASGIPRDKGGTALSFDGVNDNASRGYSATLNPTGDFTCEFWVFPTGGLGTNRYVIASNSYISSQSRGYGFYYSSVNRLSLIMGDGGGGWWALDSGPIIPLGQWSHVVGVFDASSGQTGVVKLYVNGVQVVSTGSFIFVVNTTNGFYLGSSTASIDWLPGRIDEVAVYNAALDLTTIQDHYNAGLSAYEVLVRGRSSLVSYWRLGEPSGTVYDIVSARNGTVTGATFAQPGVGFDPDKALSFDGVNDRVDVTYNASLNPAQFSIEFWVFPTRAAGTQEMLVWNRGSTPYLKGWTVDITTGNTYRFNVQNDTDQPLTGPTVVRNVWTHVVGTYDGTNARIYVNGVVAATSGTWTHVVNPVGPMAFGVADPAVSPNSWFQGRLDEVALYNAALTGPQILAQYQAGNPKAFPFPTRLAKRNVLLRR